MKRLMIALTVAFAAMTTTAQADLIVINGRYIVDKDSVRAYFYRKRGAEFETVFDVRWSDWSTQYRCRNAYDTTEVLAASLNFVGQIKETDALDFGDFLQAQGFRDCEKF